MKTFLKPLTAEEEAACFEEMEHGEAKNAAKAREKLILRNLRLVAHIAGKYRSRPEDTEELISVGVIGLIKAVDTFRCEKGRFATYASRCIENEVLMVLRGEKKRSRDVSIYEPIGTDRDGNEINILDVSVAPERDFSEEVWLGDSMKRLPELIDSCLSQREKVILSMRYGLGGTDAMTQNQVAGKLGISRSYVSRIEKRAINILQRAFEQK